MRCVFTALLTGAFLFLSPASAQTPTEPFDPHSCAGCALASTVDDCIQCIGGYRRFNVQQASMWCRRMQPKCSKKSSSIWNFLLSR